MLEVLVQEIDQMFPGKTWLTMDDICKYLNCDRTVLYNWAKRENPKRRPPRTLIGRDLRFPKRPFLQWLLKEQGDGFDLEE